MDDIAFMFRGELGKDERLLWFGRPRQGLALRRSDMFMIPMSVFMGIFFIVWWFLKPEFDQSGHFLKYLLAVPIVLWCVYFMIGRFILDAYLRSKTNYAVTNQRILILSGSSNTDIRSLDLKTLNDITLKLNKIGSGTVLFGPPTPRGMIYDGTPLPGSRRYMPPAFELIEDARKVYEVVRQAQNELGQKSS